MYLYGTGCMDSKVKQWVLIIFSLFVSNTSLYDKEANVHCKYTWRSHVCCSRRGAVLGELNPCVLYLRPLAMYCCVNTEHPRNAVVLKENHVAFVTRKLFNSLFFSANKQQSGTF